jgi:hypothetical protein
MLFFFFFLFFARQQHPKVISKDRPFSKSSLEEMSLAPILLFLDRRAWPMMCQLKKKKKNAIIPFKLDILKSSLEETIYSKIVSLL